MIRLLCILCLIPFSVSAEPASVRSGEHGTFSRLVVTIPSGSDWRIQTEGQRTVLNVAGLSEGFSTERVFDRIPRDRVSELEEISASELAVTLACDCYVDAFLWRPDELVLDVIDGPAPPDPVAEESRSILDFRLQEDPFPAPPIQSPPEETSLPTVLPNLVLQGVGPADSNIDPPMAFRPSTPESLVPDIVETEAALLEGLARAAAQGLLDAPSSVTEEETQPEEVVNANETLEDTIDLVSQNPGVGVSTAMDRDLALIGDFLSQTSHQNCLPADYFDAESWSDGTEFSEQLPILIEALAGEFGQTSLAAQDRLALFYLYHGFGAEARLILSEDQALSISRNVMMELANIIDERAGPFPTVAAQMNCDSNGAVWAFVIDPQPSSDTEKDAIVRRFFLMPQPLKGQIAPFLSRSFLEVGDPILAEYVLTATNHQDVEATHAVQAAHATVAAEVDDIDIALDVLAREAEDTARITPESAIQLVELRLEREEIPGEADLLLLATLRQEYKHDETVVQDLEETEAQGLAASGQYQAALALLSGRDDDDARSVRNDIFQALTKTADATKFLGVVFMDLPSGLTARTENEIAHRLIDLGFPERARAVFQHDAEGEDAAERRYLTAQAALMIQDYDAVILVLEGMTDDRALDLLARAYAGLGDYGAALQSAPEAGDLDEDVLAFRAEAWDRLALDSDPVLAEFASSILSADEPSTPTTLSEREAILQQSQNSRQTVEDLLSRFDSSFEE